MISTQSISKLLINLLNLAMAFLVLTGLVLSISPFLNQTSIDITLVMSTLLQFSFFCICFYMTYQLKYSIASIKMGEPFCLNTIKRFHIIATCIFILGAFDVFINIQSHSGFRLIDTPWFVLKPTSFIYILLGSLALILAEVFQMALRIKKEHDLTI